jgi:hypothetical protein
MPKLCDADLTLERVLALPPIEALGPDVLMQTETAARYLGISPKSLRNRASNGTSPLPPVKIGSSVRYRAGDILALIRGRKAA